MLYKHVKNSYVYNINVNLSVKNAFITAIDFY